MLICVILIIYYVCLGLGPFSGKFLILSTPFAVCPLEHVGRGHTLLWHRDASPPPPFPGLCLGGLLDISVDVPWMMSRSHPGLLAGGHLSPEASRPVSHTHGLESRLQP